MTIAAVATAAAAGGAAWVVRRSRATATPTPTTPPTPTAPRSPGAPPSPSPAGRPESTAKVRPPTRPEQPVPAATLLRRALIAVATVIAGVIAIAVIANLIDPEDDDDPRVGGVAVASYPPVWVPRPLPTWTPYSAPPAVAWTPEPAPTTTPPTPVPVGGVLPPNGSVIMRGDSGEEMTITVARVANPAQTIDPDNPSGPEITPRLGHRLVSVLVRVENIGGVPFIDDVERYASLVDKAGRMYPRDIGLTNARQFHPASQLDPRSLNSREIIFDVAGNVDIVRFRLSLHPGAAKQTQDWRLA